MVETVPMTKLGFERLEEELKKLKSIERPAVVKAIAEAREHGDLSENAEYSEAKDAQALNEGRIIELSAILKNDLLIHICYILTKNV